MIYNEPENSGKKMQLKSQNELIDKFYVIPNLFDQIIIVLLCQSTP